VFSKQVNVRDDERDDHTGNDARVEREKTRQGVVAVDAATHDNALQLRSDERSDRDDVGRHFCGPESFLVPRQQVAG
jgi:hypothetical protein